MLERVSEKPSQAEHPIAVRKPRLSFDASMERYYLDGNPLKTHFFNALNLLFPDGERFFVKSVHDHMRDIQDPALLRDMRAFAGQGGQHAHHHERFFEILEKQGYKLHPLPVPFRKLTRFSKYVPRALRLSITAGAEHYTASMAALMLEHEQLLAKCDPTLRDLMVWHAVEEIEHKHVAYDVFVQVYPRGYLLRVLGFVLATLLIGGFTAAGIRMLLIQDGRARRINRRQIAEAREALSRGPERSFRKALWPVLSRYFVPGFHPSQKDDRTILATFAPTIVQALPANAKQAAALG